MGYVKRNLLSIALVLSLVVLALPFVTSSLTKPSIIGNVYAQELVPISGATISIVGPNGAGSVVTASDGTYEIIEGLGTGTYTVTATAAGYIDAQIENVELVAGSPTQGPDFNLKRSGAIEGVITAEGAGPPPPPPTCSLWATNPIKADLDGILVIAEQTTGSGGNSSSWALTNADGSYVIYTGLSTGSYSVTAGVYMQGSCGEPMAAAVFVPKTTTASVAVTEGITTQDVDLELEPSGWVSGIVTSTGGTPLFRAKVTATSTDGKYTGFTCTDSTGNYLITSGLRDAIYSVTAVYEGFNASLSGVDVTAGEETTGQDILIDLPPSGLMIGRVTDAVSGIFLGGATVQATGSDPIETTTDPKGYFSFSMAPGEYTVSVMAPGYISNVTTDKFSVELNEVTRVYYSEAKDPGFLINKVTGSESATLLGACSGDANPIPEFPVIAIPAVFALTILLVLFASRKTRNLKAEKE
jgi:hypothetical protein